MAGVPFENLEQLATREAAQAARRALATEGEFSCAKARVEALLDSRQHDLSREQFRARRKAVRLGIIPPAANPPASLFLEFWQAAVDRGARSAGSLCLDRKDRGGTGNARRAQDRQPFSLRRDQSHRRRMFSRNRSFDQRRFARRSGGAGRALGSPGRGGVARFAAEWEGRDKDTKPVYLDLESYLFLEILQRWLGEAGELEVTEMLPSPDQLLWQEPDGRRTFEMRTQVIPR